MKKNLLLLLFCTVLVSTTTFSQGTYYWVGGISNDWSLSSSWNQTKGGGGTARTTPNVGDILIFDGTDVGGGTPAATITVTNLANETISQLSITGNNVNVSFATAAGTSGAGSIARASNSSTVTGTGTLFTTFFAVGDFIYTSTNSNLSQITAIASDLSLTTAETSSTAITAGTAYRKANMLKLTNATAAFSVASGCTLTMSTAVPLIVKLVSGAKGAIDGTINFNATAQRIIGTDSKSLTFNNGSTFIAGSSFSGNPFSVVANSTNDNIQFDNGSNYNYQAGSNPFAATAPASVVYFADGSNFLVNTAASAISLSGRSYGNLIVNSNNTTSSVPVRLNNLTVNNGATLTLNTTSTFPVTGNITLNGTGTIAITPNFPKLVFCGTSPQTVTVGSGTIGSLSSIYVCSDADVTLNTSLTLAPATAQSSNISGKLSVGTNTITGNANATFRASSAVSTGGITGDLTLGSQVITNVSNTTNFNTATTVSGTGIPAGAVVLSVGTGTVTISKLPTIAGTGVNLTVYTASPTITTSNAGGIGGMLPAFGSIVLNNNASYVFNGATVTPFPASVSPANLTTNANVTLNNTVSLTNTLTVSSGVLTTAGLLTLKSSSSGSARIAQLVGSISGIVNVEKYFPGKRAYRFLGHPFNAAIPISQLMAGSGASFTGLDITGNLGATNGFTTTTTNNPSAFTYNTSTGNSSSSPTDPGWTAFASSADSWAAQQGIRVMVRGTKGEGLNGSAYTPSVTTVTMSGTVNDGTSPVVNLVNGSNSNYVLVSNPLCSQIDMTLVTRGGTNVGSSYNVWDASSGARGAYFSEPFVGAVTYRYLPIGSAFFVQTTSAGTLTFPETAKASNTPAAVLRGTSSYGNNSMQLVLTDNTGLKHDRVLLFLNNNASAAFDANDASKQTNPDVNFYAVSNDNKNLSIDVRPYTLNGIIPLVLNTPFDKDFTITAEDFNVDNDKDLLLHDKKLNTYTTLNTGAAYSFTSTLADAASYGNRFEIMMRSANALPTTFLNLKAEQKNTGIEVSFNTANETNMDSYEVEESMDGASFTKSINLTAKNAASNNYTWFDGTIVNGDNYYRIKSIEKNGATKYSNIVKVKIGGKNAEFTVYPNPVKGGVVNLQMSNVGKGTYTVKLFNNLGQEMVNRTIQHNGGSASQSIVLGNSVPQGSYRMQVMNNGIIVATKTVAVE